MHSYEPLLRYKTYQVKTNRTMYGFLAENHRLAYFNALIRIREFIFGFVIAKICAITHTVYFHAMRLFEDTKTNSQGELDCFFDARDE